MNNRNVLKPCFLALTLTLFGSCLSASADTVTLSTSGSQNAYPFGDPKYGGDYQQVYSASLFGSPVEITAITFFPTTTVNSNESIAGDYVLSFSTTTASTVRRFHWP